MWQSLIELWAAFAAFLTQLAAVLAVAGRESLPWLPGGLWCAWWLWGVNWPKAWQVLARGGWVGVVLVVFASALAWSATFPSTARVLGLPLPNFWWQLGACSALAGVALFCGWLQGKMHWT